MTTEVFDILSPILGDELAQAVIEHRKAKASGKRFDAYRARITLGRFQRSPDPKLAAWEYVNRERNKRNLTAQYLRKCFDYCPDSGALTRKVRVDAKSPVGQKLGSPNASGYLVCSVAGRTYLVHRLIWLHVHGEWPDVIDHIDRDPSNNRLSNIRSCSSEENNWNLGKMSTNKSGSPGVSWDKSRKKWFASIRVGGKTKPLGRFRTIEEASRAYDAAVAQFRGQFLGRAA